MLSIQQIEALRRANPQLYEALRRLAGASLGPNQGWSLDHQVDDGVNFARVSSAALTGNRVDPAKSGVLMKGSLPPTWSGAFTYSSTTASITWTWSGLSIARADGTTTAVPNGSLTVSGLAAATAYYFYPYWDDTLLALGWAAGGSGSCLRAGTAVLTRERGTVPIESCAAGEHLRCPGAGAGEAWTRIVRLEVRDADTFIRLHFSNAETLDVTPHHVFTLADGSPMRAERLCLCDVLVGRFGRVTLKRIETISEPAQKVSVSCEPNHLFFAGRHAASIVTHNYTFSS